MVSGATKVSIAEILAVSPATVKKQLESISAKLGVRGRGRLTSFVIDVLDR